MNITTFSDKRYMNYDYYFKQRVEMVESNLNLIISKSPHVIISLDRSINHPLIRKYKNIPVDIQSVYILNITDDFEILNNCTNDKNEGDNILFKYLLPIIPSSIL